MNPHLSLRSKVLLLMTAITGLTLALYLYVAIQIFQRDKFAEVADSSAQVARSLATNARLELDATINTLKPVVEGFDFQKHALSAMASAQLKSLTTVRHLTLYYPVTDPAAANGWRYQKVEDSEPYQLDSKINIDKVAARGTWLDVASDKGSPVGLLAARFGSLSSPQHLVAVATLNHATFVKSIQEVSHYANALLGESGQVLFANETALNQNLPPFSEWPFVTDLMKNSPPPGSTEVQLGPKQTLLLAYAYVGIGRGIVLSYVTKADALMAVKLLIIKSILMFVALLCFTIIVAVLASKQITSALRRLMQASKEIATGKFDIRMKISSRDEIGVLAESFNSMAEQLSWFVVQVKEKALLEAEISTARTVQETLFPPNHTEMERIDISGRYEPASQCGGDWWYYCRVGEKVFIWIGDATGHGVPAALMTSAARSAASIIEMFPVVTPAEALQMLNRAIYQTSKGQILMTFFVAAFDFATNEIVYANASHEPPWLLRSSAGSEVSRKDIVPLNEVNNPRLGESPDTIYQEGRIAVQPGDRLFFYTDGVSELKNDQGEAWNERQFIKSVISALNQGKTTNEVANCLQGELERYRSSAKLEDDVTYLVCQLKEAS